MGAAAQHLTNVVGQRAHIGSFAAIDENFHMGVVIAKELDLQMDEGGLSCNGNAFAGQFVEFFPLDLFSRKHGRGLENISIERGEGELDLMQGGDKVGAGGDLPFEIISVCSNTHREGGSILLVARE